MKLDPHHIMEMLHELFGWQHGKDAVLVRTKWLLEYHIAGNFVGGKFSIRQKFFIYFGYCIHNPFR